MKEFAFKTLENVRDFSFPPMKEGLLYRGGALDKISKKEIRRFRDELGIKAIVDLRTIQEASSKKDKTIEGVAYCHFPLITMEEMGASSEKEGKRKVLKEHRLPDMRDYYRHIVAKERKESFTGIFNLLLEEDGPIYFHCTAGKDRTGITSALLLTLLGISKEDILADYLQTNAHPIVPFAYKAFALLMDKEFRREFKEYFLAKEELLEEAFAAIDSTYGSLVAFYEGMCGLNQEKIALLKKKYLVG